MIQSELGVLPSGHLHRQLAENDNNTGKKTEQHVIDGAFALGIAEGLIALAAIDSSDGLTPALGYWRTFTCRYLAERCQMEQADPTSPDPIPTLGAQQAESLLECAPPMRGAEYLSAQILQDIWLWFDDWICRQIHQHGSFGAFLEKNAPRWHQAGRVCFHLAENKLDPDYPFAFMATYAPEFTDQSHGRVRHQPLAKALQEYAGARNKQALIRLLSPVQRACKSSDLIKQLVESGDLYHPLARTPDET